MAVRYGVSGSDKVFQPLEIAVRAGLEEAFQGYTQHFHYGIKANTGSRWLSH
jgi:hypothetical protein